MICFVPEPVAYLRLGDQVPLQFWDPIITKLSSNQAHQDSSLQAPRHKAQKSLSLQFLDDGREDPDEFIAFGNQAPTVLLQKGFTAKIKKPVLSEK